MAHHPLFNEVIESTETLAQNWQPTNDDGAAAALAVVNMVDDFAELSEAVAAACKALAEKSRESVYFNEAAAEFLDELSTHFRAPIEAMQETTAGVKDAHREDFDRLEDEDVRKDAWDRTRNRDLGGAA